MNTLLFNQTGIFHALGLAMIHSVWQGMIILLLVLFFLAMVGKGNARIRYGMLYAGLLLFFFTFIITFLWMLHPETWFSKPLQAATSAADMPHNFTLVHPLHDSLLGFFPAKLVPVMEPACPALALVWMLGFILLGIRLIGGLYYSQRIIRKSAFNTDDRLQGMFDRIVARFGFTRRIKLLTSVRNISPMVFGLLKPVIVIPVTVVSGLSQSQIEAILAHELAHIKRYDHIFLILQVFAGQVLFFHPVSWFLISGINREREHCCDDQAIHIEIDPLNYIKALTMVQEINYSRLVPVNALTGRSSRFVHRIMRLIKPESCAASPIRLVLILIFIVSIGVVVAGTIGVPNNPVNRPILNSMLVKSSPEKQVLPDTSKNYTLNCTVKTQITDKNDKQKKDLKIVFSNDSVKELSVNGKVVPPSDMQKYDENIRDVRKDMTRSHEEMEETGNELNHAREEMDRTREHMPEVDWSAIKENVEQAMHEAHMRMEEYQMAHGDEIRQQLEMAREQIRMAMEQFRREDMEKVREGMERAREEMERAREEFRNQHPIDSTFEFMPPPSLDVIPELPELPRFDSTMAVPPLPPLPPMPPMPPDSVTHESKKMNGEQMESTLKELEKKK